MKFAVKKIMGLAVAGAFALGLAGAVIPAVDNAVHAHEHQYEDGSSNEYSHRVKEEQQRHDSAVRSIRHEYRQDGDEKRYQRRMKEEQERHDRAMEDVRHDYDKHASRRHH